MILLDLLETRTAPLYHGCYLGGALRIIADATLEARTEHQPRPGSRHQATIAGISLSRSRGVAANFGEVIFQFDQDRLRRRHRIVPHDYWGHSSEPALAGGARRQAKYAEAEEFLIGPLVDPMRYVSGIFITRRRFDWARKYHAEQSEPLLSHRLLHVLP
jgi:hypothetical protein